MFRPSRRLLWSLAPSIASLPLLSQILKCFSEWNRSHNGLFTYCPYNPLIEHRYTKAYAIESLFTEYISTQLCDDDVFLDMGACVGTFSFLAAPMCKHVYSVDASPLNLSILLNTLSHNAFKNISVYGTLISSSASAGYTRLPLSGRFAVAEITPESLSTPSLVSLNVLSSTAGQLFNSFVHPPTVAKIDIDGFELDFLTSIPHDCLKHIHTLLVEINDPRVESLIVSYGYKLIDSSGCNCIYKRA